MSELSDRLDAALGKSISHICDGAFHDPGANHCAHFVSHIADLDFSFNCKEFKGGSGRPANVRVHEIFARCPLVGKWTDVDLKRDQLVFVTRKENVDLGRKAMVNHPQKHIGILHDGMVFHYSNGEDKVVSWTPEKFLNSFQALYSGDQGLFFGTFPGADLDLRIRGSATEVRHGRAFDLRQDGKRWFAQERSDEKEFYVGRETTNGDYVGLFMKASEYYGPVYRAEDYAHLYDHWAQLLELSGYCESKNHFNLINTYDSAKFTFGFYQLAAHTPDDNLILLLRALLHLPEAHDYFPELALIDGRLHRVDESGARTDLEVVTPTGPNGRRQPQRLMDFLNARRLEHDRQEVLQSARVIHWSNNHESQRNVQVQVAADILQGKMATYARWYQLDGQRDVICGLVADIHHQGRAKREKVAAALASPTPVDALIDINPNFAQRATDLRTKLKSMTAAGQLGTRHYDAALNEFV